MVDDTAGVDIGRSFEREPPALVFLINQGHQGLLDENELAFPVAFDRSRQIGQIGLIASCSAPP
jgi:hypothetical protein